MAPKKQKVSIDDLGIPKSVVQRLAKSALPEDAKLESAITPALVRSSTVFINYLAALSHDLAAEKGQKLIAAAHVLEAVKQLGWEDGSDLAKLLKGELSAFRKATEQKKTVKKPSVPGAGPGRPSNFTKKAAADAAAAASAAAAAASADAGPTKGKGKEVKRVEIGEEEEGGATAVDAVQDVVDGVEGEGQEKMLVDDRAEGEEEEEEPYRTEDEEQEEQEEEEESEEEDEDGEEEVDEEEQARIDARGLEGASKDAIEED